MIIERQNNDLLVRISGNMKSSRIQSIVDYLRYEDLTSDSIASETMLINSLQ